MSAICAGPGTVVLPVPRSDGWAYPALIDSLISVSGLRYKIIDQRRARLCRNTRPITISRTKCDLTSMSNESLHETARHLPYGLQCGRSDTP